MRTIHSSLGEKGEIVFIRRSGDFESFLTVMVLGSRFLNITEEGTIEIINPRDQKYGVVDLSEKAKIFFVQPSFVDIEIESRNFENRLSGLVRNSEGSKQRVAEKLTFIREAYKCGSFEPKHEETKPRLQAEPECHDFDNRADQAYSTRMARIHGRDGNPDENSLVN